MATVRFSKELQDRILATARNKMQPAIDFAERSKPDNSWGQRIYDTLFGDVLPTLQQLPDGWLKTVEYFDVHRVGSQPCNVRFTFGSKTPWPVVFPDSELAKKDGYYGENIVLKDHLMWSELHAELTATNEKIARAKARQTEFVDAVKKVITTYTTLAPALKAWPPLWDLIPEDVKDKHREIKERTKAEVKVEVDFGKLTAMATAAKMGV